MRVVHPGAGERIFPRPGVLRQRRPAKAAEGVVGREEGAVSAFVVERQIHGDACVAAAAVSLLRRRGLAAPRQEALDPLLQAGMRAGRSGFDALREALGALGAGCTVKRLTPAGQDLVAWIASTPAAADGFLISHHVQTPRGRRAHVTLVFAEGGRWLRADPDGAAVRAVELHELVPGYAGDVAVVDGVDANVA